MALQTGITLRQGEATPTDIRLYSTPVKDADAPINIYLYGRTPPSGGLGGAVFPAVGDVDAGVAYGPTGADYTGTLVKPAVGDVQQGVGYGAAGTELTGTFAWPGVGDVRLGIGYGAAGSEFTGDLTLPAEADVLLGVQYGAAGLEFTGTLAGGGGGTVIWNVRRSR